MEEYSNPGCGNKSPPCGGPGVGWSSVVLALSPQAAYIKNIDNSFIICVVGSPETSNNFRILHHFKITFESTGCKCYCTS